jgi:nucleoside-diphosphate-sugar epimerase
MLEQKQILITGGAGFIGAQLIKRLVDDNQIVVLDTSCCVARPMS